ncbi:MAG TPA: NADPH-dependent 7-cyano-7-deazaguanine reductase QueF [Candidatus Omnitrophica bacterium]|nr:NADPH-dependent 7-cyano-7-deazaguanine reductase QueF [Candidatus Omnitrophota bacterium]
MGKGIEKKRIENLTLLTKKKVKYPSSPEEAPLETFSNSFPERDYWIEFNCPEFTSLCPVTGQPDFGKIIIQYIPDKKCIESKSLKFFLFSFRNYGSFAEDIVNIILNKVVNSCKPRKVKIIGEFFPRGGISIKVEANYP